MEKKLIKMIVLILGMGAMYGFACPYLISSDKNELVIAGGFLFLVGSYLGIRTMLQILGVIGKKSVSE